MKNGPPNFGPIYLKTMIKSETIRKAMGISALAYQNSIDTHFHLWCNKYAEEFALPLGKMAGDDYLQNWYRDQWTHKVELPFYIQYRDYLEAGIEAKGTMQDFFLEYPDAILEIFPKSLFDNLKRSLKTLETNIRK